MAKPKSQQAEIGLCGYVLPHGPHAGEVRPAMIVRSGDGVCDLVVFTASGDELPLTWSASAAYDAGKALGTWHKLGA